MSDLGVKVAAVGDLHDYAQLIGPFVEECFLIPDDVLVVDRGQDPDLVESNEAFAAQACAVSSQLNLDVARVNPNGGAIALGHPVGATGAIIMTKLVHELHRINGRYGMATMCIGGGQGISLIIDAKP